MRCRGISCRRQWADALSASSSHSRPPASCRAGLPASDAAGHGAYLSSLAAQLLAMPAGRKARYAPLVALLPHVGARALLAAAAAGDGGGASTSTANDSAAAAADGRAVVAGALRAMESDMVANSAAAFLKALLEGLRREAGALCGAPGVRRRSPSGHPPRSI